MRWLDAHPEIPDAYVFSKMALNLYTLRRAPAMARRGVRINAVCPGNTITPMTGEFIKRFGEETLSRFSATAGTSATPEQQAAVIVFLASPLASYINGVLLEVDGGFSAAAETRQLARG
jgi:NAD(P)-dependent dehydrogenase (short-subunit alcohol dehydrogenase family)